MKRLLLLTIPFAGLLLAQSVSLTIGNPVASQDYVMKSASFVFRVNGCTDLSKAQVSATAEGLVDGMRRSVPLRLPPSRVDGVYGITPQWGREGRWLIAITANCTQGTAGAIVPMGSQGFVRDAIQMFPHAVSQDEIEVAMRDHTSPQTLR